MKNRSMVLAANTLTALLLAGCAGPSMAGHSGMGGNGPSATENSTTQPADTNFNDVDVAFTMEMVMHHQQAIEMVDMLLVKDDADAGVVALAEHIKASQQPEIDTMTEWLQSWGYSPANDSGSMEGMDHGDMSNMGGMMSEEDMAALEAADGPEASRLFLEQMIVHHEGAIEMAEIEVRDGQSPSAVDPAERIIDD